jgi:hypothetical protein
VPINQDDNISLISDSSGGSRYGTRISYLTDRLRTQHPDVFAALEHGEYRSVHAAARAAGIRKQIVQHVATVEGFSKVKNDHIEGSDCV